MEDEELFETEVEELPVDIISLGEGLRQYSDESMGDWITRCMEGE